MSLGAGTRLTGFSFPQLRRLLEVAEVRVHTVYPDPQTRRRSQTRCYVERDALARRVLGDSRCLGFSTHNERQLAAGDLEPVDYLAVGPVLEKSTAVGSRRFTCVRSAVCRNQQLRSSSSWGSGAAAAFRMQRESAAAIRPVRM